MPQAPKPANLKAGHSKGKAERRTIGLVPVKPPSSIIPKAPTGLLSATRKIWRAYWESQVSGAVDPDADMHRIQRWIMAVDEYERVLSVFRKARLVKGSQGQPVLNPLAGYLQNLEQNIGRAEAEMGLTPMARLRLGITFGVAQLTAEALNRALDEKPGDVAMADVEVAEWEGQWEAV